MERQVVPDGSGFALGRWSLVEVAVWVWAWLGPGLGIDPCPEEAFGQAFAMVLVERLDVGYGQPLQAVPPSASTGQPRQGLQPLPVPTTFVEPWPCPAMPDSPAPPLGIHPRTPPSLAAAAWLGWRATATGPRWLAKACPTPRPCLHPLPKGSWRRA